MTVKVWPVYPCPDPHGQPVARGVFRRERERRRGRRDGILAGVLNERDRRPGRPVLNRRHIAGRVVPVLVSLPPATVAVLVTLVGALLAIVTVSVIAGEPAPAARASLRVQLRRRQAR